MKKEDNSQAIQSHLAIIQNIIQRMSTNSTSSKAWCITLVSAILIIVADKSKPQYYWLAILPIILFYLLDCYYLYLEKGFRNSYNIFIEKLHTKELEKEDLYVVSPTGSIWKRLTKSLLSFSTLPFYLMLGLMTWLVKFLTS
jgi:hypothetical protein